MKYQNITEMLYLYNEALEELKNKKKIAFETTLV